MAIDEDKKSQKDQNLVPEENLESFFLDIDIKSRKKQYFTGKAHTLTSNNETGVFDVLPYHANFITLVKDYIILDLKRETEQRIDIENGVLSVQDNKVDIYLDL